MINPAYKIFFPFIILAFAITFLTVFKIPKTTQIDTYQIPKVDVPKSIPVENIETRSSDGKMKLTLEIKKNTDSSTMYSVFASSTSTSEKPDKLSFLKIITSFEKITIPQNSWSPDNKYFFFKKDNSDTFSMLLFKADGSLFPNNQQSIDITSLFSQKITDYILTDITGWDSETLLHVFTSSNDRKEKGPSFWFDITTNSFIQLASR